MKHQHQNAVEGQRRGAEGVEGTHQKRPADGDATLIPLLAISWCCCCCCCLVVWPSCGLWIVDGIVERRGRESRVLDDRLTTAKVMNRDHGTLFVINGMHEIISAQR